MERFFKLTWSLVLKNLFYFISQFVTTTTIYGNSPGVLIQPPTDSGGNTNTTIWQVGQVKVTQLLQIVPNSATGEEDLGKISYTVENLDTTSHQVGLRIMIDTEINGNDGAPFRVPNTGMVTNETEFLAGNVPENFEVFRNVTESNYAASAVLRRPGETSPDRVVFAGWRNIVGTAYDYTVDPSFDFTGDSAYAVYWLPQSLAPEESRTYLTYYGLDNVSFDPQPPLALAVSGPAELSILDGEYSPNPFEVVATVNNVNTVAVDNVQLTLSLPPGLTLQGGNLTFSVGTLQPGQEVQHSWLVKAMHTYTPVTLDFTVTATGTGTSPKEVARPVSIPALTPPDAPPYSTSHYMLTTDKDVLLQEGCREALNEADRGNRDALIILYFGDPDSQNGSYGADSYLRNGETIYASTADIEVGSEFFLTGYWQCSAPDMRLTLAIGTNNTSFITEDTTGVKAHNHGTAWAEMINNIDDWRRSHPCRDVPQQMCGYSRFAVAGAIDIEGWGKGGFPVQTTSWVDAYDAKTLLPYYNFGSCENCYAFYPPSPPTSPPTEYSQEARVILNYLWYVSWGAIDAYPMPEIYNTQLITALDWYNLSRYGTVCDTAIDNEDCIPSTSHVNPRIRFPGVTTQWQRCTLQGTCPGLDNAPDVGWQQLFTTLDQDENTRISESVMRWSTDMIWDRLGQPYPRN